VFAQNSKEIRKSFTIDKSGEVEIDTYKGRIKIEPSGSDVVDIYIKIEADENGFMNTNAKKQIENADVEIEASSNSVRLKSIYKHDDDSWLGGNTRALVNYVIKMPKTATLNVKDYKSDTDVTGLESNIKFETYKGKVNIKGLAGSIKFETYKGEADIKFAKLVNDSRFETYKGDITISLPKSTPFSFSANFGRRVDFDNEFNMDIKSSSKKHDDYDLSGKINGGGPEIKLSSEKGSLKLQAD
jgi:hypothetical protein